MGNLLIFIDKYPLKLGFYHFEELTLALPLNIKIITLLYCLSKCGSNSIDANRIARFRD